MSTFFVRLRRARAVASLACATTVSASAGCADLCTLEGECPEVATTGAPGTTGETSGSTSSGPDEEACPEDPSDGPTREDCGVWASSSLGDDKHPGTRTMPVATLARAVEIAGGGSGSESGSGSGKRRVYACAETFAEGVVVPRGVSLFGGFDCAHDWQSPPAVSDGDEGMEYADATAHRTVIAPAADVIPLLLAGAWKGEGEGAGEEDGEGESVLFGLSIRAADAKAPGGSSIGVLAEPGARAALFRCDITAGDGADGAPGAHGGEGPAPSGLPGSKGWDACSGAVGLGGPPVIATCDDDEKSVGGNGGNGGTQLAGDGSPGTPEPTPNPANQGAGGEGQTAFTLCTAGTTGASGGVGTPGLGGAGPGRLTSLGFSGPRGKDGSHGKAGQGGGGGGSSLGKLTVCPPGLGGGAGGGSGGSGGCGGKGGKGGRSGGASIGIATRSDGVRLLSQVHITTGTGGRGGKGGTAQLGGSGGAAGPGGSGAKTADDAVPPGCPGMFGGHGGHGGHGGGGAGGPSIGVAYSSFFPPDIQGLLLVALGKGGPGGNGGNPGVEESVGADGGEAEVSALEP